MTNKNDDVYVVSEGVAALLTALDELGLEFKQDSLEYEYDKDEGQFIYLLSDGIPEFEVGDEMTTFSDFEWIVKSIKKTKNGYRTTFLLEDVI